MESGVDKFPHKWLTSHLAN